MMAQPKKKKKKKQPKTWTEFSSFQVKCTQRLQSLPAARKVVQYIRFFPQR